MDVSSDIAILLTLFSTLAQVIATILSLFGFYVLYKLQSLNEELFGVSTIIINEIESDPGTLLVIRQATSNTYINREISKSIIKRDLSKISEAFSKIKKETNEEQLKNTSFTSHYYRFEEKFNLKNEIIRDLKIYSYFSVFGLVWSLLCISCMQEIMDNNIVFIIAILFSGIIIGAICKYFFSTLNLTMK